MMTYLLNTKKRKAKAHIWDAEKNDTVCRMYSTGNLSDNHYVKSDHLYDKIVCSICEGMNDHNQYNNRLIKQIEQDQENSIAVPTSLVNDNNLSWSAKGVALFLSYHCDPLGLFDVAHIRSLRLQNSQEINQALYELSDKGYIESVDDSETVYRLTIIPKQ